MKVIRLTENGQHRLILLFGVGLIGRCIFIALRGTRGAAVEDLPFDWEDSGVRGPQLASLRELVTSQHRNAPIASIHLVWAAGKAGFGAGVAQLEREDESYDSVLELAERLASSLPETTHHFHMMSSAGGLFEGQRLVDQQSKAAPLRPYGWSKLEQERRAGQLPAAIACSIYRPSSVYGYNRFGGRAGLITVLVDNSNVHRTSHIYGDINTLRDYVLADDIGRFVAGRVLADEGNSGTFLMASGKPATIAEVLRIVETVIARRLYVRFERQQSNADHMTFACSALPSNWRPTDLETGVRLTAGQLLGSVKPV